MVTGYLAGALVCALAHVSDAAPWRTGVAAVHPRQRESLQFTSQPYTNYTQTQYWYTSQVLDHFNLTDTRTYSQRYWLVDDFWASPQSPVILYLCGTCHPAAVLRLVLSWDRCL